MGKHEADRPEEKGQGQNGDQDEARQAPFHDPARQERADEEIEGQVVNPARQRDPWLGEERLDIRKTVEPAVGMLRLNIRPSSTKMRFDALAPISSTIVQPSRSG